jgi:putative SOS response-associated peptidase YedK
MANVVLTEEDAKRWISKCSGKQQERLAHLLKPKDQTVLSLSSYGGANVHSTQRIEIKIATRLLESVSQAIGRPIINRGGLE